MQSWTHRKGRREKSGEGMKEVQLSAGGLEKTILQMSWDFLRWTEREPRFQLMAHPHAALGLPTPPIPAPAVGSMYFCGCQRLPGREGGTQQEIGLGKASLLLLLLFKNLF